MVVTTFHNPHLMYKGGKGAVLGIIMLRHVFVPPSPSTVSVADTGSEPESAITPTVPHTNHDVPVYESETESEIAPDSLAGSPPPQPMYETDATEDWWAYALSGV
jgi:hypothetical protein